MVNEHRSWIANARRARVRQQRGTLSGSYPTCNRTQLTRSTVLVKHRHGWLDAQMKGEFCRDPRIFNNPEVSFSECLLRTRTEVTQIAYRCCNYD